MRFYHYPVYLFLFITFISFAGCKEKDKSLKLNEPRNIKGVISYKRSFGDLNDIHLKAAQSLGIRPLTSREEAERMKGKLVHIKTMIVIPLIHLHIPSPSWYHAPVTYLTQ